MIFFFSGVIFSPKCECPLLYLGPSVPEILIGVIFAPSSLGPSVPETYNFTRKQLLLWRSYLPTSCCFPLFLIFLLLFIYIFIQPVLFCLHVGSFSFLFLDVFQSGKRCEFFAAFPNHLQLVASRKQCLHQKRKVPFVLIWLVLSTGSFGALYNGFCHILPIRFMLRPT